MESERFTDATEYNPDASNIRLLICPVIPVAAEPFATSLTSLLSLRVKDHRSKISVLQCLRPLLLLLSPRPLAVLHIIKILLDPLLHCVGVLQLSSTRIQKSPELRIIVAICLIKDDWFSIPVRSMSSKSANKLCELGSFLLAMGGKDGAELVRYGRVGAFVEQRFVEGGVFGVFVEECERFREVLSSEVTDG